MTDTKLFNCLIVDSSGERNRAFRLNGKNFRVAFALSFMRAKAALTECQWDVVFYSGFFGDWKFPNILVPELVDAHKKGFCRAVIVINPVRGEGESTTRALQRAGVPACFIPFNYDNPSQHSRLPEGAAAFGD